MVASRPKDVAVFGGGCFWCTEAMLGQLRGVISVMPGYAGGSLPNPTYEQVSSGKTGHAEVVKIEFDPKKITYHDLLTVFFASHDPTTPNRQGADIGPQYRSIVLYTSEAQKEAVQKYIRELDALEAKSLVTEVKPLESFYEAEAEHKDFYNRNPAHGYSQAIIAPKLAKVQQEFTELIKTHL